MAFRSHSRHSLQVFWPHWDRRFFCRLACGHPLVALFHPNKKVHESRDSDDHYLLSDSYLVKSLARPTTCVLTFVYSSLVPPVRPLPIRQPRHPPLPAHHNDLLGQLTRRLLFRHSACMSIFGWEFSIFTLQPATGFETV